jgi:hypothetical protein
MYPYELDRLAKQRTGDIRKAAARYQAGAARRDRGRSIRHRAGWVLVQIGLSLISRSASSHGHGPALHPSLPSARPAR